MEIQVHLMPQATFYPSMLLCSKFCHRVSLTTEKNEMQRLTWCPLVQTGAGISSDHPVQLSYDDFAQGRLLLLHIPGSPASCKLPNPTPANYCFRVLMLVFQPFFQKGGLTAPMQKRLLLVYYPESQSVPSSTQVRLPWAPLLRFIVTPISGIL